MIGRLWRLAMRTGAECASQVPTCRRFLNLCAFHSLTLRRMKHRVERDVCDHVGSRISARCGGIWGARAAGCTLCTAGRAFAAARLRPRYALWGGFPAACADVVDTVHPRLAIETQISPALSEARCCSSWRGDGRASERPSPRSAFPPRIRWRILQLQPNMTYFALNIHGNNVAPRARETARSRPSHPRPGCGDPKVVAKRDGIVGTVHALDRRAVVQAGGRRGTGRDTLIQRTGTADREEGNIIWRMRAASGSVYCARLRPRAP